MAESQGGPSSFEVSNQMGNGGHSNPGSSKSVVNSGAGIDGYMASSIDNHIKSPNLSDSLSTGSLDHMNPIGGQGIFSKSATEFLDEAGKMAIGNINPGPLMNDITHEGSVGKSGLGNFSPGKQIGAEKGVSQSVVGRGGE